jgi:excinuclease ABC subunit A
VADLVREGFTRAFGGGAEQDLEALVAANGDDAVLDGLALVVDRLDPAAVAADRVADAVKLAYGYGRDEAVFQPRRGAASVPLSRAARCPTHGSVHAGELTPRHFSFNAHLGACPRCDGLGRRVEIDRGRLLPEPGRPLDAALDPRVASVLFRVPRTRALLAALYAAAGQSLTAPWDGLPPALQAAVLDGDPTPRAISWVREWGGTRTAVEEQRAWEGLLPTIEGWAAELSWLKQEGPCGACGGGRLAPALLAVTLGDDPPVQPGRPPGRSIAEVHALTVSEARRFWSGLEWEPADAAIAAQPVEELLNRLRFLEEVGLGYLGLSRGADTLSGGEAQRIRLATQLGSRLTGTIYVLDEPTIGLHPRDTARLLASLTGLRDLGNTLVVVEHDPAVIAVADHLVDMGPGAGEHGGRVMAQGSPAEVAAGTSLTGDYLAGRRSIPSPDSRRTPRGWLTLPPSSLHNLQNASLSLPLGVLVAVTGVSGSGKSTLLLDHAAPWLQARAAADRTAEPLVCVDQSPIGRTPRSTPATFCEIMGPLRTLFSETPAARARGWGPSRFSFNGADDGRCPHCEGRGLVQIEMHFLSDLWVRCDKCGGRRYTAETLEIRWRGLSIADVLDLPAAEARELFSTHRAIRARLDALVDVGLGYLRLGQDASTLSGGEAQRLKLATELVARKRPTLYLLDEPTTGLHLEDVARLLTVLHRLVDAGHTVVLVEHHLDLIRNADWVIDLGPEAGPGGGRIIAEGPPGWIAAQAHSWTGRALAGRLDAPEAPAPR